jgi:hypothetical protein
VIGAVCDVSVLKNSESFEQARGLTTSELCLPSATYAWVCREKLVTVRNHMLGHTFLSQLVRDGKLLVVYLPELLDEISRRLLFHVDREIPLTDLRATMLATHLGIPLLTLEEEPADRLKSSLGALSLARHGIGNGWRDFREVLERYRCLAEALGTRAERCLSNGGTLEGVIRGLEIRRGGDTGELVEVEYLTWDLLPVLREYLRERVLPVGVVRGLCRHMAVAILRPRL